MSTEQEYRRGRHVVSALHVHLVFVTKYRRGVLTGEMVGYLAEVFGKVCEDFGAVLAECNGEDDHVHLLVEYPPKVTVSALVNSLKGVSARRLRQRYRVRTHREHLWSPSYFAASCGGAPLSIIRAYVESQRRPDLRASGYPRPERRGLRRPKPRPIEDLRAAQYQQQGEKSSKVETSTTSRDELAIEASRIQAAQARMQMYALVIAAVVLALGIYGAFHK